MKAQAFKALIKEAVKEAIQEELKEVLLEAVRAPRQIVNETPSYSPSSISPQPVSEDRRAKYANILGETAAQFNSQDVNRFNPQGAMPGGDLPSGTLGMDQIMGLMNK
jgi:hypothetical protein